MIDFLGTNSQLMEYQLLSRKKGQFNKLSEQAPSRENLYNVCK